MVEHLVYTERVGGSSPSPPTIRRWRWVCAIGVIAVAFGMMRPDAAAAGSGAMTFRIEPLDVANCGARCPHVIVADGVIETTTPRDFVDFLKSGADDRKLRRVVFFNSRGGNVVASMAFGHILRELRVAGVVGRFHGDGDAGPYVGECLSACVYAMMGAVRRVAPPGSEVALHRMSIVETEPQGWFGQRTKRSFADAPMVAVLVRYARRMGVSPALVRAAESLPPDTMHVISREEMRRWSFAVSQF